ncbi:MAG TPA: DISARM system phospholipase D-like protein DrmC [Baekduia sp.]|nr:DISARM system phospholipase D-like protein DrmC [Baekduia sp.]
MQRLADAIEASAGDPTAQALAVSPSEDYRSRVTPLLDAWARMAEPPVGGSLALALRTAADAVGADRASEVVDVVWTGPSVHGIPVHLTGQVLVGLLDEARERALILSFAAKPVPLLVEALTRAHERSVVVDLIIETAGDGPVLKTDDVAAFSAIGGVRVWRWPKEQRPVLASGLPASLHAKAVVIDARTAFVTSANLTAPAIGSNLELGLVVRGGQTPRRIADQLDGLLADGVLVRA